MDSTLQFLKEHFNTISSETNDSISNETIEEAGPIFSWFVSCQEIYWITWMEFCHDLFQNYPLKKVLMVLFNIKNISIQMQKALFKTAFYRANNNCNGIFQIRSNPPTQPLKWPKSGKIRTIF